MRREPEAYETREPGCTGKAESDLGYQGVED